MHRIDTRGEGQQGALVAIVLLILALFAVFFFWQRDSGADDAELEIDINGGSMVVAPQHPDAAHGQVV